MLCGQSQRNFKRFVLDLHSRNFFFVCDVEAWNVGAATIPVGVSPHASFHKCMTQSPKEGR